MVCSSGACREPRLSERNHAMKAALYLPLLALLAGCAGNTNPYRDNCANQLDAA